MFVQTLNKAARSLWAAPKFSLPVLLSLYLGLLGLSMVGAVIENVLLRALPFPNPHQLVAINEFYEGRVISMTQQNARDLETADTGMTYTAAYVSGPATVQVQGKSFLANTGFFGADFFRTLQVKPMLGQTFPSATAIDQNANIALISESMWRERFGGAPDAIGKSFTVSGRSVQVLGVIAQAQIFPAGNDIWLPDRIEALNPSRSSHGSQGIGRLRPDQSLASAQIKINALGKLWKANFGQAMTTDRFPIVDLRQSITGDYASVLWITVAAAVFLLLIAGLNASNLWLVRSLSLRQQTATKLGLGAKPSMLALELLLQALLLCTLALLAAGLSSSLLLGYLQPILQTVLPRAESIGLSRSTLVAMAGSAGLLAFGCALVPILRLRRRGLVTDLTQATRSTTESRLSARTRSGLTALQTALTVVMLCGTLLLWQSMHRLLKVDTGFRVDGVVAANVSLIMDDLEQAQQQARRYEQILQNLAQTPGVSHAALSSGVPLSQMGSNGSFLKEAPGAKPTSQADMDAVFARYNSAAKTEFGSAQFRVVSQDYFQTLDMTLRQGRGFQASDTVDRQHVAVISESLAKSTYPNGDAIGQRIQFGGMDGDVRQLLIVGIVSDVRSSALDAPPDAVVYVHLAQRPRHAGDATIVLTGSLNDVALTKILRNELDQQPDMPTTVTTLANLRDSSLGVRQPLLMSFAGFVTLASLLAALGIYGLVRYNLAQKSTELFVRRAIGASAGKLLWQNFQRNMSLQLSAIGVGLVLSALLAHGIASQLYEVPAQDPLTLIGAGTLMALLCAMAIVWASMRTRILRDANLRF